MAFLIGKLFELIVRCGIQMIWYFKTLNFGTLGLKNKKMSESKSILRTLIELLEVFFNSSRNLNRKRTWHQHVVPYEEGWAVRREGNKRITSKHRKQSTAIEKAKRLARKYHADVIIHRENGEIRERINYDS